MLFSIILLVIAWIAILAMVPSIIHKYKAVSSLPRRKRHGPDKNCIIRIAFESVFTTGLIIAFLILPNLYEEEFKRDKALQVLASIPGIITLMIAFATLIVCEYCDSSYAQSICNAGNSNATDNTNATVIKYAPNRKRRSARQRRIRPIELEEAHRRSNAQYTATVHPANHSRTVTKRDTSKAILFILDEYGKTSTTKAFDSIDQAKNFMNRQTCADIIIISSYTYIASFMGYHSRPILQIGMRELNNFCKMKNCHIVREARHYLELTKDLGNDDSYYSNLVEAYVANVDYGD